MDSQHKDNPIRKEKLNKLDELLSLGVNPYPHNWENSKNRTSCVECIKKFDTVEAEKESENKGKKLFHVAGRLMRKRPMGKAAFFNIRDESGDLQCYIRRDDFLTQDMSSSAQNETHFSDTQNNSSKKAILNPWVLWKLCDIGDIVGLSGELFKTKKGEISLRIKSLEILCKTLEPLPEKYHGLEDKELKYRYRHLDLIMDLKSREVFKARSKIIKEIRSFMNERGFMEVETPVLQPIYGGANALPF